MRTSAFTLQVGLFALAVVGAALVLAEIGMRWDDWLVLAVVAFGVLWLAQMVYHPESPPRSIKRRFGRSSGPDAPAPRTLENGRGR